MRPIFKTDRRACITNWPLFGLNSWPDCVAISGDIARYGSNSDYSRFKRKMLGSGSLDSKIMVIPQELYV